jgi:hypothetical protein
MEHDNSSQSNPGDNLDDFLTSILDKEALDMIELEEDEYFQKQEKRERQSKEALGAYCVDRGLLSQDLVDKELTMYTSELLEMIDDAERNAVCVFERIGALHTLLVACEQDDTPMSYLGELEEVRDLIGSVAQAFSAPEQRAPWIDAIRDTILPLTKQLPGIEFEMAVEQADLLHDLKNLEDHENSSTSDLCKAATVLVNSFLETTYGAHDDIDDLARVIVAVARFRHLNFPMQFYEEQLDNYRERYPLAEMYVEATIALLGAELDR